MSDDGGFGEMQMILKSLKHTADNESIEFLRSLAENLRKDPKMKQYFYELNGVSTILNFAMDTTFAILNNVFDVLAAAAEDHEGNRKKLTLEKTFILIRKVLVSTESLGLAACLRPLVLLSYICAENVHAQELACASECVTEMEKLFLKFLRELLCWGDIKEEKLVFTWNILCTAIASVCGEPANKKNQERFRSVIREGANFLNEWFDNLRHKFKNTSCIKNLLIMLPYIVNENQANQDYFAKSGGVQTVVSCLINLENQKSLDDDLTQICVKLVYLLSVTLIDNSQISKLAGFLGVIPVLVRLLKYFNKKDKGIVLLCLVNLLNSPENEREFLRLDIFTSIISEMKVFEERSECWNIIKKICDHLKRKQKFNPEKDLSDSSNSSLLEERRICTDHHRNSEEMYHSENPRITREGPLFSRYMHNVEKAENDTGLNSRSSFNKSTRSTFQPKFYQRLPDDCSLEPNRRRSWNDSLETPNYYKRAQRIKNDDSTEQDKHKICHFNMKYQHDPSKAHYNQGEDSEIGTLNQFHKSYERPKFSSLNEYGKNRMHSNYGDRCFQNNENTFKRQYTNSRDSSSELINKARQLYPRNKMMELEEIDVHQKRHYLTKRDNITKEESQREMTMSGENKRDHCNVEKDQLSFKDSMKEGLEPDFQKDDNERKFSTDRDNAEGTKERMKYVTQYAERRNRSDMPRRDYPKFTGEQFKRDSQDNYNREFSRKSMGGFGGQLHRADDSRKQYFNRHLERYTRDNTGEPRREYTRMSQRGSRIDCLDGEMSRKSPERFMKEEDINRESWKYDSQRSRYSNSHHKRSKSVGRLSDLDIQTMLKDMDIAMDKKSEKQLSNSPHNKNDSRDADDKQNLASSEMPKLVSVRDAYHKYISQEVSPRKQLQNSSKLENSESALNSKSDVESNEEKKDHNSASIEVNHGTSPQLGNNNAQSESVKGFPFSVEEEKYLVQGIQKHGLDFKTIFQEFKFHEKRTPHDLYEKWKHSYNF